MKLTMRVLPVVLLLVSTTLGKELSLGSSIPLPDLKMLDVGGKELSLNDITGSNGLVVIFSCNTCPWVDAWEDRYVELANAYLPKGFGFVAVNSNAAYRSKGDSYDDMQSRAKKMGYTFYYTLDKQSELARAFGATRTPHVFVFDADRKLVYRGAIDDNAKRPDKVEARYLADALDACLAGKDVKTASTKALGCTIKFDD
ncbi:MAG: thioredoxin family protein [Fidelibacterota bacterium]|nr:MAG: thioredoxin family protein [Candidatus Neomarinimicrobiota bacterium]